jgi:hypothetical protein
MTTANNIDRELRAVERDELLEDELATVTGASFNIGDIVGSIARVFMCTKGAIRSAVMILTAFALLAFATLAKNEVSWRFRLTDACAGIFRAFAEDVSDSHSQRFAPTVSVCRSGDALAMSGIGPHLFRDVMPPVES